MIHLMHHLSFPRFQFESDPSDTSAKYFSHRPQICSRMLVSAKEFISVAARKCGLVCVALMVFTASGRGRSICLLWLDFTLDIADATGFQDIFLLMKIPTILAGFCRTIRIINEIFLNKM